MKDDFLYLPDQILSRVDFKKAINAAKELFKPYHTIVLKSHDPRTIYSSILAAIELQLSLYLCPSTLSDTQTQAIAEKWGAACCIEQTLIKTPLSKSKPQIPCIGIFTSGTTGEPKIALHSWEAITAASQFVPQELHQQTWMQSYSLTGYAGLQVFFSAWNSQGALYCRADHFKEICQDIVKYGVTIISATPTFWKMLIGAWPSNLQAPKLLQATLGGEIVDQPVIDLIDHFFHPARLTHIYASTEAGSAIVVSDKKAGFPTSLLEKPAKNGVRLRIVADELQIQPAAGMKNYLEGVESRDADWIKTGDIVLQKEDRIYFLGRTDGRINIGGRKVCREEIEQALNSLEEIEDCLVYEKKSPIVGSLIAADVIVKNAYEFSPAAIKQRLKEILEEDKIPHIILKVDHFAISSTGKKIRKSV